MLSQLNSNNTSAGYQVRDTTVDATPFIIHVGFLHPLNIVECNATHNILSLLGRHACSSIYQVVRLEIVQQ